MQYSDIAIKLKPLRSVTIVTQYQKLLFRRGKENKVFFSRFEIIYLSKYNQTDTIPYNIFLNKKSIKYYIFESFALACKLTIFLQIINQRSIHLQQLAHRQS